MYIVEAVKTGKRFRRKGSSDWNEPYSDNCARDFDKHDILADDWEIEEETVEVTRSQLRKGIGHCIRSQYPWILEYEELFKELGFKKK
jgi:hypothetical protein